MDEIKKNPDEISEEQLDKVSGGTRIDPRTQNNEPDPPKEEEGGEERGDPEKQE